MQKNNILGFHRRTFMKLLGAIPLLPVTYKMTHKTAWANEQKTYNLVARGINNVPIGKNRNFYNIMTYNDGIASPVLRFKRGEKATINLINRLPDNVTTTVHWHGVVVPLSMDGVPYLSQPPVTNGDNFTYSFTPPESGTFWYHSHAGDGHQTKRGLSGTIVVEEDTPPAVDQDLVWHVRDFMQESRYNIANLLHGESHGGALGDVLLVNDADVEQGANRVVIGENERIRLRIVNACSVRTLKLYAPKVKGHIIALDGHPIKTETWRATSSRRPITMGAGQRMDLIIDGTNIGQTLTFYNDRKPMGQIVVQGKKRNAPLAERVQLPLSNRYADKVSAIPLTLEIDGGAMPPSSSSYFSNRMTMMMKARMTGNFWFTNGNAIKEDDLRTGNYKPMFTLDYGNSYVITINNHTSWEHPLHIHALLMEIIERNGVAVNDNYLTDTLLIAPRETLKILIKADVPGIWMFHCHITDHMKSGMSGIIRVRNKTTA